MYHLQTMILVLFLLAGSFSYAENINISGADNYQVTSSEQYAEKHDAQPADDKVTAVCQADSNYPCCCKVGGSRSCTTKSECDNNGGKCTDKDHYGKCPQYLVRLL